MLLCDLCKENITYPKTEDFDEPEIPFARDFKLNLNGKHLVVCLDCISFLGEFVDSEDFKKGLAEYRQQMED